MHKFVLQPNEVDKMAITVETSRFIGPKTMRLWLSTKRGEVTQEFVFTVTGISDHSP